MKTPIVQRLEIRNYKSIVRADIPLTPLTMLVGRNGAGKSNVLDALRFTSEALGENLEYAIRHRGGIDEVRRRSLGSRPPNFHIQLHLRLGDGQPAAYGFKIAAAAGGRFRVDQEVCRIGSAEQPLARFQVSAGLVETWPAHLGAAPAVTEDRLFLGVVSGVPTFRPVWEALRRMAFHNLNPEEMKRPQKPEPGDNLSRDGHNLASVVKHLESDSPNAVRRVVDYLNAIGVPITSLNYQSLGSYETVQFSQKTKKTDKSWQFVAAAMSDGTIRATGILVSLLSATTGANAGPTLVGVEEPETALHPAASGALFTALHEAAESTQIVLTCHSPDLLEHPLVDSSMIRAVVNEDGETRVGTLSPARTRLLEDHLATAGELLRLDQLSPDPDDLDRQETARNTLWGTIE